MVKMLLAVCLMVLFAGCKGNAPPLPPEPSIVMESSSIESGTCEWQIRIFIDNSFMPAEMMDIGQAMGNWNKASGGRVCFTAFMILLNPRYEMGRWRTDGRNTLYSGTRDWHKTAAHQGSCKEPGSCSAAIFWQKDEKAADIFYISRDRIQFRALAEHELGHMLGLWHSPNSRDLMYRAVVRGYNYHITHRDREMLRCLMDAGEVGKYTSSCRPAKKKASKQSSKEGE